MHKYLLFFLLISCAEVIHFNDVKCSKYEENHRPEDCEQIKMIQKINDPEYSTKYLNRRR